MNEKLFFIVLFCFIPMLSFGKLDRNPRNIVIKNDNIVVLGFFKSLSFIKSIENKVPKNSFKIFYNESESIVPEWKFIVITKNNNVNFNVIKKHFPYWYYASPTEEKVITKTELSFLKEETPKEIFKIEESKNDINEYLNLINNIKKEIEVDNKMLIEMKQ